MNMPAVAAAVVENEDRLPTKLRTPADFFFPMTSARPVEKYVSDVFIRRDAVFFVRHGVQIEKNFLEINHVKLMEFPMRILRKFVRFLSIAASKTKKMRIKD
jgi:hypothetical protein